MSKWTYVFTNGKFNGLCSVCGEPCIYHVRYADNPERKPGYTYDNSGYIYQHQKCSKEDPEWNKLKTRWIMRKDALNQRIFAFLKFKDIWTKGLTHLNEEIDGYIQKFEKEVVDLELMVSTLED